MEMKHQAVLEAKAVPFVAFDEMQVERKARRGFHVARPTRETTIGEGDLEGDDFGRMGVETGLAPNSG